MEAHCPGRKANVHIESSLVPCPACGKEVEVFTDEFRVHCRCGTWVFHGNTLPLCAQWCAEAERCLGTIGHPTLGSAAPTAPPDRDLQEQRMKALRTQVDEASAQDSQTEQQNPHARD